MTNKTDVNEGSAALHCYLPDDGREPVEMLMRLLVQGGRVEQGGFEFAMGEDGSLCYVDSEGVGHGVQCDMAGFKRMADDIGRDELWLRLCQMQLVGR